MDDFENEFYDSDNNDEETEESVDINSEFIRGHINTIILHTLIDGEKYGTQILEEIRKKSDGLYTMKQPTLYGALKRLASQGYVTSYWGDTTTGGRKRFFSLTEEGKAVATKNIDEWEHSRTVIDRLISEGEISQENPTSIQKEKNETSESSKPQPFKSELKEPSVDFTSTASPSKPTFTDETYHKIRKQSQFEGEYRHIIDSIYDTANSGVKAQDFPQEDSEYHPYLRKKILKEPEEVHEDKEDYQDASYQAIERYSSLTGQPATRGESVGEPNIYASVSSDEEDDKFISVKKMNLSQEEIDVEENDALEPLPYLETPYIDENDSSIDFTDLRKSAREEKLKFYYSSGDLVKKKIPDVTFNKGATLFRTSVILLIICFLEAIAVLLLKDTLEVSLTYPFIMVLIPVIIAAVFGVLTLLHYGEKTRKEAPKRFLPTAGLGFVLCVLAIAAVIIAFSFPLDTLPRMFKYLFIPCIYSFNLLLFAFIYYALVKNSRK